MGLFGFIGGGSIAKKIEASLDVGLTGLGVVLDVTGVGAGLGTAILAAEAVANSEQDIQSLADRHASAAEHAQAGVDLALNILGVGAGVVLKGASSAAKIGVEATETAAEVAATVEAGGEAAGAAAVEMTEIQQAARPGVLTSAEEELNIALQVADDGLEDPAQTLRLMQDINEDPEMVSRVALNEAPAPFVENTGIETVSEGLSDVQTQLMKRLGYVAAEQVADQAAYALGAYFTTTPSPSPPTPGPSPPVPSPPNPSPPNPSPSNLSPSSTSSDSQTGQSEPLDVSGIARPAGLTTVNTNRPGPGYMGGVDLSHENRTSILRVFGAIRTGLSSMFKIGKALINYDKNRRVLDSPLNDSIVFEVMKRNNSALHARTLLYAHDPVYTNVLFVRGTQTNEEWRDNIIGARGQALLVAQTAQVLEYCKAQPMIQHIIGHSRGAAIAHDAAHKLGLAFCGIDGAMVIARAPGALKARNINKEGIIDSVLDPIGPKERASDGTEKDKWERTHHAELGKYTDDFTNKIGEKPMEDIATGFEYGGPNVRQGSVKRARAEAFEGEENVGASQSLIERAGEAVEGGIKKIKTVVSKVLDAFNNIRNNYTSIKRKIMKSLAVAQPIVELIAKIVETKNPAIAQKIRSSKALISKAAQEVAVVTEIIEEVDSGITKAINSKVEEAKAIYEKQLSHIEKSIRQVETSAMATMEEAFYEMKDDIQKVQELANSPEIEEYFQEFSEGMHPLKQLRDNLEEKKKFLQDQIDLAQK